jgi:hypothetical protein
MSSSTLKAAAVVPAAKSKPLQPSELLNKLEGGSEDCADGCEVLKGRKLGRRRRAKSGLPEGVGKLEERARPKAPASLAQRKAQRVVLERNERSVFRPAMTENPSSLDMHLSFPVTVRFRMPIFSALDRVCVFLFPSGAL